MSLPLLSSEAPSLPPPETLALDLKEALGMPPTPSPQSSSPLPARSSHSPQRLFTPPQPVTAERGRNMASSGKARSQFFELCKDVAAAGDRVAQHMTEYSDMVKHHPHGFDALASQLLDICQILFYIEAALGEAVRTAHSLPLEMVAVLDQRFRATQADFRVLGQMVDKFVEYERKGTVGRFKRGFGKIFGDHGIDKMAATLQQRREDLKMSALVFQWSLGSDEINSEFGIGYIGLAAALDRTGLDRSQNAPLASKIKRSVPSSRDRNLDASLAQPVPLVPSIREPRPESASEESSTFANTDLGLVSPTTRYTVSSTTSSHDVPPTRKPGTLDRLGTFDEGDEPGSELDALLADLANFDLDSSKVVRLKSEPLGQRASSNVDADKIDAKHELVAAIRRKDHKLAMQFLDRGVSPNTGADAHALNEAIISQDTEGLRLLLLYGADPNEADRGGMSPLAVAAENSFLPGAALLLKYGADANGSTGPESKTLLELASAADNIRFVHLLLVYGGNPNQVTVNGNTLLIDSIGKKTPRKLVDLLLGYGADPNGKNREGKTALFEAIQCARADVVTSLLDSGANPNLPGPKHVLWPSASQPACLRVLFAHGADHKRAPGVMELAASTNSLESVGILLSAGVDPNAKKDGVYTPLCTSIRDDRVDIFQLLLTNGADPNLAASEYPTFKCVTHHRAHFLPALVAAGAKLNSPRGIVESAVSSNNPEALGWLLDQGLDPNEKNAKGHTPLTSAIRENRVTFVEMLLARGANPNIRGQDWPVCMAVQNPEILRRILAVLAEPRAFKGVMEMAVAANQLESLKLLLAAGVSVEDRNGGVFSPLTTAIRNGHRDIVVFLLDEGGADVNAPGEHLPIVKALRRGQDQVAEMVDILLDKGADPNKLYRGWNGIMQALENGDAAVLRKVCEKSGVDLKVKDDLGRTVADIAISRKWEEAESIVRANAA